MQKGKGIAEEKVGKYLDDKSYKVELVAFFKKFDEEEDDGCNGVDRKWQKFESYLSMESGSFDEAIGGEENSETVDGKHGPLPAYRRKYLWMSLTSSKSQKKSRINTTPLLSFISRI